MNGSSDIYNEGKHQTSTMKGNTFDSETGVLTQLPIDLSTDKLFSDELASIFQWITFSTLCQVVALFGVGSNIVNTICFAKQGFQDPVNVSFFGLAIVDFFCLTTLMWVNLCINPAFIAADLPFNPVEFQHLTGAIPHTIFTRISSWMTAVITLERCLCIIAPIKVKNIVTSKRVAIIIMNVVVILWACSAPIYVVNRLGFKFDPKKNKTFIGLLHTRNRESVDKISYLINNVFLSFGAFMIIMMSTIVLVIQLHNKTKWRKASTISTQADNVSMRNQKVAKMVVMISVLFIACFTPVCVLFISMSLVPGLSVVGKHRNGIFIFSGFGTLLESINCSANIFIYYHMSSKYRVTLGQLFGFDSKRS